MGGMRLVNVIVRSLRQQKGNCFGEHIFYESMQTTAMCMGWRGSARVMMYRDPALLNHSHPPRLPTSGVVWLDEGIQHTEFAVSHCIFSTCTHSLFEIIIV